MQTNFPKYIWGPFSLGGLESDDLTLFISGIFVTFFLFLWLGLATLFTWYIVYRPWKRNRPRGAFRHFMYRINALTFPGYPHGSIRKFRE